MSEHEAIEWRLKQLYQMAYVVVSVGLLIAMITATVLAEVTGTLAYSVMALVMGVVGLFTCIFALSMNRRGYARVVIELILGKRDDPPLDEWGEKLEANNSFPVDNNE